MKPREIKAEIIRMGLSVTDIANESGSTVPEVSMCISGYRMYPRIRQVIAKKFDKTVAEVFADDHPQPKRSLSRAA